MQKRQHEKSCEIKGGGPKVTGGLIMAIFLIATIQANLCCLLQLGIRTKIYLNCVLKILPLSDHHSHFWAATFDSQLFCMGCTFFYNLAAFLYIVHFFLQFN